MERKICTFFGHRNANETLFENLYIEILKAIEQYQITDFYIGNHGRFDILAKKAVEKPQRTMPSIKVHLIFAYLPTKKENALTKDFDGSIYPDGLEYIPKRFAISHRNRWMIAQADVVISHVITSYGGAYTALTYAKNQHKIIINIENQSLPLAKQTTRKTGGL